MPFVNVCDLKHMNKLHHQHQHGISNYQVIYRQVSNSLQLYHFNTITYLLDMVEFNVLQFS